MNVQSDALVLFGATGDLAHKKIYPALQALVRRQGLSVPIIGTANIPNFGFYTFEIKRPDETIWFTIQAGNSLVNGGKLGDWAPSRLVPGQYQLGLVVVDNQAQASPACVVQLNVIRTLEATPGP